MEDIRLHRRVPQPLASMFQFSETCLRVKVSLIWWLEMIYESVVKPYFVYQNVQWGTGWQNRRALNLWMFCRLPGISHSQCFSPVIHASENWICRESEHSSHILFTFDLCFNNVSQPCRRQLDTSNLHLGGISLTKSTIGKKRAYKSNTNQILVI